MKKAFLIITILLVSIVFTFADTKNIVYSKSFDLTSIENIDVSLTYENLQISRIYGEEIVVEIGSNNIKKIPDVFIEDGLLKIKSKEQKVVRGNKCNVYIYLPQDFNAQSIVLQNISGNINADILETQNSILLSNVSGRTDVGNIKTELLTANSVSGNITLQKLKIDYFETSSTDGNIFLELEQSPQATCQITNISGKTQLYYPKTSDFDIVAFTISGNIKSDTSENQNVGTTYRTTIGSGGAQISISSISGKIEFIGY